MKKKDQLFNEAVLGRDAFDFLNGELGQTILLRCEAELTEAQDLLASVSPWRRNRIRDLQNQIWRAKSVPQWLAEIVASGRQAEQILDSESDDD